MNNRINVPIVEEYSQTVAKAFVKDIQEIKNKYNLSDDEFLPTKNITFQVTEDCNLACTYCYQHNKTSHKMDITVAKKVIDAIFEDEKLNQNVAFILDFIGGEPLLEVDLIDEIIKYFLNQCFLKKIKLVTRFRINICSNGTLYFNEKVQNFIKKYHNFLSFSISVDGNKELHDSCRVFKNSGEPSYDKVIKSVEHYMKNYGLVGTKMTFSKENIKYIYEGIINLLDIGFTNINCNCAFEPEWDIKDAQIIYKQFKKVADYIINNNLENKVYISFFDESIGTPKDWTQPGTDKNWCGGNGAMLAMDYNGIWYPCLRYMPSSLGDKQPPITCGDIVNGINHSVLEDMQKITWKSQSTEECINCPIATGCAWCTAYNYEVYGTINKRSTNICVTHKARSLINSYFYNKCFIKHNIEKRIPVNLIKDKALDIISEQEYEKLVLLAKTEVVKDGIH